MRTTKVRLADGHDIPIDLPAKRIIAKLNEHKGEVPLIRFPATNGIGVWINPQYVAAVWQMPEVPEADAPAEAAPAVNGTAHPEPVAG